MSPLVQPWPGLVWGSAVLCWTQVTSPNVHSSESAQSGHGGQGGCCEHLGAAATPPHSVDIQISLDRGRENSFLVSTCGAARSAPPRGCRWWRSGPPTPSCGGRAAASAIPRCRMFTVRMLQTGAAVREASNQRWLLNTNIVFCINHCPASCRPHLLLCRSPRWTSSDAATSAASPAS